MLQEIINKKIDVLRKENHSRYIQFLDRLSDVSEDNIRRYGFMNMGEIPIKEKIYHGFQFKYLVAFDKASNDRWDAILNTNHRVSLICEPSSLVKNNLEYMLDKCLDVKNDSNQSTMALLLKYILFSIGDSKYKELDSDITDEMLKTWYTEMKLAWLTFNPFGLFLNKLNYNYGGLGFVNFMNSNKYDIGHLLIENDFISESEEIKLALRVEVLLYAPYALKHYDSVVTLNSNCI